MGYVNQWTNKLKCSFQKHKINFVLADRMVQDETYNIPHMGNGRLLLQFKMNFSLKLFETRSKYLKLGKNI